MSPIAIVPLAWLKQRYAYDPQTGTISFVAGHAGMRGRAAGTVRYDGYLVIRVSYQGRRIQVMAHVLAWLLHHGVLPSADVDHRNLDRADNRIDNLREASRSQNLANRAVTRTDLPKGVTRTRSKRSPYQAQITVGGTNHYLGAFACPAAAHAAYAAAATAAFGEFTRLA